MFSRHRSIIVAASSRTNDESGKRKSMMRKLALRGRVKGVGGITQQIGEKVRAEREGEWECVYGAR